MTTCTRPNIKVEGEGEGLAKIEEEADLEEDKADGDVQRQTLEEATAIHMANVRMLEVLYTGTDTHTNDDFFANMMRGSTLRCHWINP